uniref:Kinesin-like protein n=1 Tax=Marsilea vestita TaxID=59764 RepID=A0A142KWA4_MARVE|nr:kinesin 7-IIc protein [Marsilea vestita]
MFPPTPGPMDRPPLQHPPPTPNPNQKIRDKILVTVRVRPLSSREIAQNDTSAWECVDDRSIIHRPPASMLPERSPHHHPKSYVFDHVFGPDSVTLQVYERGAKDVALSALSGINATIFAYGQTSSGKTYTMRGITENAVRDMYAFMEKHSERDFVIKISAIEIYNEVVRDLLNTDASSGPLRLLDDPERGTRIEKLVEDVVRDSQHLQKILSVIEAQRQVGETQLNETSSRSHQIIRLTVESFPKDVGDGTLVKSLIASLNLVDLAGSERVSQTQAEGTRLKEGCHINRSLLTLTTIIRKLSQGRVKTGHLPYRDSKLTRILQNSLGGNARTAIICTMSPAQAHVEQSRNTLFFATQAKEVTNTAQVNMVVSDKDMVKLLQKEVARLEAELKVPTAANIGSDYLELRTLLRDRDAEIERLRAEVKQLHYQKDLAQSQLEELRKRYAEEREGQHVNMDSPASPDTDMVICTGSTSDVEVTPKQRSPSKSRQSTMRQSSATSMMLIQEIRKLEQMQDALGEDANRALQALQKEVECLRLAQADMNHGAASTIAKLQDEIKTLKTTDGKEEGIITSSSCRFQDMGNVNSCDADTTIATLEEKLQCVQKSIDNMVLSSNCLAENTYVDNVKSMDCKRSSSPRPICRSLEYENDENSPPIDENLCTPSQRHLQLSSKQNTCDLSSKENTAHKRNNSVDIKKMQSMFKTAAEENIRSIRAYVMELKEKVAKLQYQKQLLVCQVLELESNAACAEEEEDDDDFDDTEPEYIEDEEADTVRMDNEEAPSAIVPTTPSVGQSIVDWKLLFQKERMQIAQLWDLCQVSIIHRSQFYLAFKGDPADQVYMEVELRRLAWLQEHFDAASSGNVHEREEEGETTTLEASMRAIKKERETLAKRMRTNLNEDEREEIYHKWGVYTGGKQRKMQVAYKVWTDPHDEVHIQDSAELVAKVMGFWNPDKEASKEMFELAFAPPSSKKPWLQVGWNNILNNFNALNI